MQDARVRQIPILWELGTIRPGNTMDLPVGIVPGTYKIQAVESHNIVFQYKVVFNTKTLVCTSFRDVILCVSIHTLLFLFVVGLTHHGVALRSFLFSRITASAVYIRRTPSQIWTIFNAASCKRTRAHTVGTRRRQKDQRRSTGCLQVAADHSAPMASHM